MRVLDSLESTMSYDRRVPMKLLIHLVLLYAPVDISNIYRLQLELLIPSYSCFLAGCYWTRRVEFSRRVNTSFARY